VHGVPVAGCGGRPQQLLGLSLDANKQLYRWLLELWNGDLAIAGQLVTPDFVGSWPGQPAWSMDRRSWPGSSR
jgi:hypothetical protein